MDTPNYIKEYMRGIGRMGGKETASKYDKKHFQELQRKSVISRKQKLSTGIGK